MKTEGNLTSSIKYNGDLRTSMTHTKSGQVVITDAPVDNNGKGAAFSPTDLLASSLASCMLTIIGIEAGKIKIEVISMEAQVVKHMNSIPRKVRCIELNIQIGIETISSEQKESLTNSALNCPVAQSLSSEIEQRVNLEFVTF